MGEVDLAGEFAACRSAWRLCARDEYDVPEEAAALAAWERSGAAVSADDGWLPIVAAARRRGASIGRVQVISTRPPGRYAQWLLAVYPLNVTAGEDVRVAYRTAYAGGLRDLTVDFWLFDDARVARLVYDHRGRYLTAYDDTAYLADYRRIKDHALTVARPIGHAAVA